MASNASPARGAHAHGAHDLKVGSQVVVFTQTGTVWGRLDRLGVVGAMVEVGPGRFVSSAIRHVHPAAEETDRLVAELVEEMERLIDPRAHAADLTAAMAERMGASPEAAADIRSRVRSGR